MPIDAHTSQCDHVPMYGFGILSVLIAITIGVFVFLKPDLTILSPAPGRATSTPAAITAARDICIASAKAAYTTDLMIAGVTCPNAGTSLPDTSCVRATNDGAKAYAKYESAIENCGS